MAEEVEAYRKSLSTLSSGVVESLSSASITSWQGAGSAASGSPKMSRLSGTSSSPQSSPDTSASIKPSALLAVAKPFSPQGVRELKIQSQLQPHSEILKQLEMEMSQSPQATILRRMKEESRNEEGNSSAKVLEDERIIKLEKEATARELAYLLAEEVPVTVADMLRALTACMDDLKGDPVEDEGRGEQIVQETMEEQKARLRKKVALNLDSMLKYGSGPKGKEKLNAEDEEKAEDDGLRKGPKLGPRSHLLDLSKKTDEGVTSLRGFAAISGWTIYKSDLRIDVKPTWGKKMPLQLKAQISSLGALRLAQIQNAHNYTRMAIGELSRLQQQMEKNAEARILIDALQRITNELRMAREELVNGMPEFPDNLFAPTAFLPALPPDIAIEFHVCDSQLVLSIYILQISPVPAKLARESAQQHQGGMLNASGAGVVDLSSAGRGRTKSHMRQTPAVGQSYVVQGKKVEVMDAIRLPCDVPLLKAAVHALEQANDLASDMKDKLLAVST